MDIKGLYFPFNFPELIKNSDAVIVPENNFGVDGHTSRIPLEAICCQCPLFLSDQVAQKQPYIFMKGCYQPFSPNESKDTANKIRNILQDKEALSRMRECQQLQSKKFLKFDSYIDEMEKIFHKYADKK